RRSHLDKNLRQAVGRARSIATWPARQAAPTHCLLTVSNGVGPQRERDSMLRPAVVMSLSIIATNLFAQTRPSATDAQSRTAVIASSFTKFKDVTKSKHGITKSKYRRVETTAAIRANPADYSGVYEDPDFGFGLKLSVDSRGAVTGSG